MNIKPNHIVCGEEFLEALNTLQNTLIMKEKTIKTETKEPIFKEGQFVRIKKREGEDDDYKYSFTDRMTVFEGDICVITRVDPDYRREERKQKDDNARYYLKGHDKEGDSPAAYAWASSMLEEAELPEPTYRLGQKVRIVKRQTFDGKPLIYGDVYYTDEMLKHRGEVHEIEGIDFNTGAFLPQDDYHIYRLKKVSYAWTKSMLEPIEEEQKPKDEVAMLEENSKHFDKAYESYKLKLATDWPEDAKFHLNQKVQIASVITDNTNGFDKQMIDYASNEATIETVCHHPIYKEYFYRLDEENGGTIWWPESLLTEIN